MHFFKKKKVHFVYICFMKQLENTGNSFIGHWSHQVSSGNGQTQKETELTTANHTLAQNILCHLQKKESVFNLWKRYGRGKGES